MNSNNQFILIICLIGIGAVGILVANVWYLARRIATDSTEPRLTALVKFAWVSSLVAVLFPIIAPLALILAGLAYLQARKRNQVSIIQTGLVLAIVNSLWAIIAIILVIYGLDLVMADF